ncbi:hypothetical protein [Oceanirhabdus sp. W0125-5]|uniref:hypothetical protein n=1 Tax=Oceanirhabdus sp. W0125-5 TaxID=2999116 RepID=UPI0022F2DE6B|nr:hypothetical protein [Oceanirhabdus sp. W0125-5]WBW96256.1 hypothetical protein OW730_21565 [Oceanirhabdus sp. W0125-5]
MTDNIKYYKFVKDLQKLSDDNNLNLKINHIVKEGEVIIVFRREFQKFGMKYEKINHLTHENILEWVESNFYAKVAMQPLKSLLEHAREIRIEEEEKERREQEKKRFRKV